MAGSHSAISPYKTSLAESWININYSLYPINNVTEAGVYSS